MIRHWITALVCAGAVISSGAYAQCDAPDNGFANCGFESGDFQGWQTADITNNWVSLSVVGAGFAAPVDAFDPFLTAPTEGTQVAVHGFDGDGPGTVEMAQDIVLSTTATNLTFDYRAGWDTVYNSPSQARIASVEIQPAGGGTPLASTTYLTVPINDLVNDTGAQSGSIDVSAFADQYVRIVFVWYVPEQFTGPAQFQLDNVFVSGVNQPYTPPPPEAIPASPLWSLMLLAGLLPLLARRKLKVTA